MKNKIITPIPTEDYKNNFDKIFRQTAKKFNLDTSDTECKRCVEDNDVTVCKNFGDTKSESK